jgi:hypothetical protein
MMRKRDRQINEIIAASPAIVPLEKDVFFERGAIEKTYVRLDIKRSDTVNKFVRYIADKKYITSDINLTEHGIYPIVNCQWDFLTDRQVDILYKLIFNKIGEVPRPIVRSAPTGGGPDRCRKWPQSSTSETPAP